MGGSIGGRVGGELLWLWIFAMGFRICLVGCFVLLVWCKIVIFKSVYGVFDIGPGTMSDIEIAISSVSH